ncbi:MAG: hypothetical protein ACR2O1_00515 [Boseongicola sp.]
MIYHEEFSEPVVNYFKESDPFTLDELLGVMQALSGKVDFESPFIHDLRDVDLPRLAADDMENHILKFKHQVQSTLENPCAFIVRDVGGLGKMRMWGVLAEISGIRHEDLVLVTTEVEDAVEWVADKLHLSDPAELQALVVRAEQRALLSSR